MNSAITVVVVLVAVLHLYFLTLEMFLWETDYGRKNFRMSREQARMTVTLAKNMGLYNGFLAAGLLRSFFFADSAQKLSFQIFFLSCVFVAGAYGAVTVNKRIFFVQALPALIGLALIFFS